jgi:hypothetical protein
MNVRTIRTFPDATYTSPPIVCQIGRERAVCFMSRPITGGPMCVVNVVAGDGRDLLPPLDMREFGREDCFGATPFVSDFDGTIKLFVNCKHGDGNDRDLVLVETGVKPEVTA